MQPFKVADHFSSFDAQLRASRLGMWLFLATEILLFAGLFVMYAAYRWAYAETFRLAARHMELGLGTANTLVLITSSLTVALAFHFTKEGRRRRALTCLAVSIALALGFLGIKAVEYASHFREGALWGALFRLHDLPAPGASLFFTLYFAMTGLHALHVCAGMSVLAWLGLGVARGRYGRAYHTPVELGGMYWHLFDLVWIFLYPLLYLID
jgi:cytochrome c oxidase subunit III